MQSQGVLRKTVVCVRPGTDIEAAHSIMVRRGIRHLPVVKERKLLGVLSDRDLLMRVGIEPDGTLRYPDQTAGDAMTVDLVTASLTDSIQHVASLMVRNRIDCVPVVDDAKDLLGIVTSMDLLEMLSHLPSPVPLNVTYTLEDGHQD